MRRVLVITRRYWPLVDDSTLRLMHLMESWRSRGVESTVLTGRWHAHWPEHSVLRDTPVVRLLPAPRTNWNEGQFQRNAVAWIQQRHQQWDAIYVDRGDGLLSAIAGKTNKWQLPLITRFTLEEPSTELARSQWFSPAAVADMVRRSDRVVVPNAFAQRVLKSHGIPSDQITWIPDFVRYSVERHRAAREAANAALYNVATAFVRPARTDLIVHLGTADAKSLGEATLAVCDMLDRGLPIQMWVVGAGPATETVYDSIKMRGWHREIQFFDPFDDIDELIAVADLAIVSNPSAALQFSTPLMVNSELPIIMAANVESTHWLPETHLMKWYDSREALVERLRDWSLHRQQWTLEAAALKAHQRRHRPAEGMLDLWQSILHPAQREARG
jgi:hypothetical protein